MKRRKPVETVPTGANPKVARRYERAMEEIYDKDRKANAKTMPRFL